MDSEVPVYEYSEPEIWKGWTWSERYPGRAELRRYFAHVDKIWDIKKDVEFNTRVIGAQFDVKDNLWKVETDDGRTTTCKFLISATGFATKPYIPDIKGVDTFKGILQHPYDWPQEGIETKNKRVGIIGTGASGVQIAQECAKDAESLVIFQRTPNFALPMRQRNLTPEEQESRKSTYPDFYRNRLQTFGGMRYSFSDKKAMDATPEEREAYYEQLWENGGFEFWLGTYADMLFEADANRTAYDFWAKKTRERINDPKKKDILAPLEPVHPFGTKRPSLEQDFYEIFNQPNVDIIDINKNGIKEIKPDGILMEDGTLYQLDMIAMATGYDNLTGGLTQMGLRDIHGKPLAEDWKDGVMSYLGMCHRGYPNFFYLYGALGPTSLANGPTCAEVQGQWAAAMIQRIQEKAIKYIEPTPEAEAAWKEKIETLSNRTLLPLTNSYYMGANIPGKKREQLNWTGGLPSYDAECKKSLESWDNFVTA